MKKSVQRPYLYVKKNIVLHFQYLKHILYVQNQSTVDHQNLDLTKGPSYLKNCSVDFRPDIEKMDQLFNKIKIILSFPQFLTCFSRSVTFPKYMLFLPDLIYYPNMYCLS